MALVHITHYNVEAESADRTIALTGRESTHEADMIETVAPPAANAAIGHTDDRTGARNRRCGA